MSAKNIQTYLAVGLGLFCALNGYTAGIVLIIIVEFLTNRVKVKAE